MSVVILFGVCWLPLQTYYVTSVVFEEINSFKYINIVWFFSHWLAMSNSCVNPFIYFFCHVNVMCVRDRVTCVLCTPFLFPPRTSSRRSFRTTSSLASSICPESESGRCMSLGIPTHLSKLMIHSYSKDVNGRVTYRGRNYYLTHSVSSDEEKQDVMRQESTHISFFSWVVFISLLQCSEYNVHYTHVMITVAFNLFHFISLGGLWSKPMHFQPSSPLERHRPLSWSPKDNESLFQLLWYSKFCGHCRVAARRPTRPWPSTIQRFLSSRLFHSLWLKVYIYTMHQSPSEWLHRCS